MVAHGFLSNLVLIPALQTSSRPTPRSSNAIFRPSITNTSGSSVGVQPSIARSARISRSKTCRLTVVTENHHYISTQMLFTQSPIEEICSPEARFCDGIHCFNEDSGPTELLSNRADVVSPFCAIPPRLIKLKFIFLCSCVYLLPEMSKRPGRMRQVGP